MARVEAIITPSVLRWARERSGFNIEVASHKIGRSVIELLSWENGESRPTIPQLRKISEAYKRPLAVFYLPEPPKDFETLRDFRSLPIDHPPEYSPELSLLIRTAHYRMEWMSDFLKSEGEPSLPFIGSISLDTPPIEASKMIMETLHVSPSDQTQCRSREEALRVWIDKTEKAGIFVFRQGKINLTEARGFVLCNDYAPFIYINSEDAKAAQLFTLAHEIAHLWLDECGISNLEPFDNRNDNEISQIEVYCNEVASNLILNRSLFEVKLFEFDESDPLEDIIEELSSFFKVSEEVIARRMLNDNLIDNETYEDLRQHYQDRWQFIKKQRKLKMKEREGGPSYYVTKAFNNGYAFTQTIVGAYESGAVSGREASGLLGVKINNIRKLASTVGMNFL